MRLGAALPALALAVLPWPAIEGCGTHEKDSGECVGLLAERALRQRAAKEPVDCETDAQCALFWIDLECVSGCAVAVRKEALERLRTSAAELDREYCDGATCVVQATCARGEARCEQQRCAFVASSAP